MEKSSYLQTNSSNSIYDELPLWSAPFGIKLLEMVKYKPNLKILDIGFGGGFPLIELSMRFGSSSKIYGIDPSETAHQITKNKINILQINNIELIKADAEIIPLQENSIDLIVSNNGINNVKNPSSVLAECYRIAKEKAQFIVTMNLPETMILFYNTLEIVLEQLKMFNEITKMNQHIEQKRKTHNQNIKMITSAGFSLHNTTQDMFYLNYVDGTAFLNHYFIKTLFLPEWKKIIPVEKHEQIFSEVEAKLNQYSIEKVGLKMSIPFACYDCYK